MMLYINRKMKLILEKYYDADSVNLLPELKRIIDSGFREIEGMIFFKKISENLSPDTSVALIVERYGDRSGFEYSINGINIDDYINVNILEQSYIFFKYFKEQWLLKDLPDCIATLSFSVDVDYGHMARVSFYLYRLNEKIIEINEIESYEQPIMVELINNRFCKESL